MNTFTGNSSLSIIIPVYNEERTIASIVEIVKTWGKASEIIVVNDGSSDKTLGALAQFKDSIKLISRKRNRGKGYSLAEGVRAAKGDLLLFMDGDVVGLTHRDLDRMLTPMLADKADMVLGVSRFWGVGSFEPFNDITGQRVVWRRNIEPHLAKFKQLGYGIELFLNDFYKGKRVVRVRLPHVFILGKWEKQGIPEAMVSYVKEARDLLSEIVRQQTGEITPQAKRLYRAVLSYLRRGLDYLQT